KAGSGDSPLRFDPETVYLIRTAETPSVYDTLRDIGLSFDRAEWVADNLGLCAIRRDRIADLDNLMEANAAGVLELLRRAGSGSHHDLLADHRRIVPVVDFLCSQSPRLLGDDLRLAFLVRTAAGTHARRRRGVVFLRPENPSSDEEHLWE